MPSYQTKRSADDASAGERASCRGLLRALVLSPQLAHAADQHDHFLLAGRVGSGPQRPAEKTADQPPEGKQGGAAAEGKAEATDELVEKLLEKLKGFGEAAATRSKARRWPPACLRRTISPSSNSTFAIPALKPGSHAAAEGATDERSRRSHRSEQTRVCGDGLLLRGSPMGFP